MTGADSFKTVPVTSSAKRADGLYDIQQCFSEAQCSADGTQCSTCQICKKSIAHRVSAAGLPASAYAAYPASKDGAAFYVPEAQATEAAIKELKAAAGKPCLDADPCTAGFKPYAATSYCCPAGAAAPTPASVPTPAFTIKDMPWWAWTIVGVIGLLILVLIIFVFVMVFRSSPAPASAAAHAAPPAPAV